MSTDSCIGSSDSDLLTKSFCFSSLSSTTDCSFIPSFSPSISGSFANISSTFSTI
eukprot:Gb_00774 [translate_table: standard]